MPVDRNEQWTLITASLVILAAVAVAFIFWFTSSVMIPFVLAVFVVAVMAPISDFLELRLRFRRWMSILAVLGLVLFGTVIFILLLTFSAQQVASYVGTYTGQVTTFLSAMLDVTEPPPATLEGADIIPDVPGEAGDASIASPITTEGTDATAESAEPSPDDPTADESDGGIWALFDSDFVRTQIRSLIPKVGTSLGAMIGQGVGSAVGILSTFTLMIIFVLFLLAARDPKRLQPGQFADIEANIRSYLATKTALSAITGTLVAVILGLFGLNLSITFGVLAFLLNYIPSIGSVIATLVPLPVAFAQFIIMPETANWWMFLAVLLLPGVVQMTIGNVIEPRIMGEGLNLHPITILFALTFWGLLWGWIGAILAVPITAVVRIALGRFESLKWIADIMAGQLPE